jgi:hypothetical protein
VSDHHSCNSLENQGCTRCFVRAPNLCCDVDSPQAFTRFSIEAIRPVCTVGRSRLNTNYIPKIHDQTLRAALETWAKAKVKELYGEFNLENFGPSLVLPFGILNRIVDCAHYSKIKLIEDLEKQTRRNESD